MQIPFWQRMCIPLLYILTSQSRSVVLSPTFHRLNTRKHLHSIGHRSQRSTNTNSGDRNTLAVMFPNEPRKPFSSLSCVRLTLYTIVLKKNSSYSHFYSSYLFSPHLPAWRRSQTSGSKSSLKSNPPHLAVLLTHSIIIIIIIVASHKSEPNFGISQWRWCIIIIMSNNLPTTIHNRLGGNDRYRSFYCYKTG